MVEFSPREIVSELDRFIIGQNEAKRAVALALRNRWRRKQLPSPLREDITPKNILMIGPTGVGKTEISRRLAKLARAPFLKVEATKFTEIGYVGRDVDQIIRDLVEASISMVRERYREKVRARAEKMAENRVLDALTGAGAKASTREAFRSKLRSGELADREIDIEMSDNPSPLQQFELPGQSGIGVLNLNDMIGKALGRSGSKIMRTTIAEAHAPLIEEECDRLLDEDAMTREALHLVENDGIVFIDEIDKVAGSDRQKGSGDVSREGVQRDLLPLIEGTSVATRYGSVRTDHVLFIASGAFHKAKPSDLLPELQGRLPIRVELSALDEEDFARILVEPETSFTRQYAALIGVENVQISFAPSAIKALAALAVQVNATVENIGARRLHTLMEKLLDDISFTAPDRAGESINIDATMVENILGDLVSDSDLSRYVL